MTFELQLDFVTKLREIDEIVGRLSSKVLGDEDLADFERWARLAAEMRILAQEAIKPL